MRLKHIRLAGFKSFVDPITTRVPTNLVGIVGPNGCGKSNVIDAIRWVMGESSIKTLRGESMDDVIFNGSSVRKPIGKASVSLLFDNSNGKAPGPWGRYKELEIRREVVRDSGSSYFINQTRCRRRDIQDIFLGTGLGPRSYSIIEQGMVGRIVESKPEDLRALIEEAAGISKYRERRRETENRISRTRANIERVQDILSELATQLQRLKRQANDAERFKNFKDEERQMKARLLALRTLELSGEGERKDVELAKLQTEMDAQMAEQRWVEARIEVLREQEHVANEELNTTQVKFYELGAEISSIEQAIQHAREKRASDQKELKHLLASLERLNSLQEEDAMQLENTAKRLRELEPHRDMVTEEYQGAETMLSEVESSYQDLQLQWDLFGSEAQQPERVRDIEAENIKRAEQELKDLAERVAALALEKEAYQQSIAETEFDELRDELQSSDKAFETAQSDLTKINDQLAKRRTEYELELQRHNEGARELESLRARLQSLQEIQSSALNDDGQAIATALYVLKLKRTGPIAGKLRVRDGWEAALDALLGDRLSAITVDRLSLQAEDMPKDLDMCLVDSSASKADASNNQRSQLLDYIDSGSEYVADWLSGVYVADSLDEALRQRGEMEAGECLVSKDGTLVGRNWLLTRKGGGAEQNILARSKEINELGLEVEEGVATFQHELVALKQLKEQISSSETERGEIEQHFQSANTKRTQLHNRFGEAQVKSDNTREQFGRVSTELLRLDEQKNQAQKQIAESQRKLAEAESRMVELSFQRKDLIKRKKQVFAELSDTRGQLTSVRDRKQSVELEYQGLQSSQTALQQNLQRLDEQVAEIEVRQKTLNSSVNTVATGDESQRARLDGLIENRRQAEKQLAKCRDQVADCENKIRERDKERMRLVQNLEAARETLNQARMARQELSVRLNTLGESDEYDADVLAELSALEEVPKQSEVEQALDKLSRRIERIGPVNLVAIEEYKEGRERKEYLDSQCADLTESLQTLESAIAKIDRETRALFKETFDELNEHFQNIFPRLFGGGKASLEMTGTDLLTTGVTVMARPPGKRNSTIHLLSGGEKALAAVSLLFGFFELNPAPFCVLDEVDAPLDDANVERYVGILKSLSAKTQILFISHNKITMESADVLVGITMNEPGVSHMVSVDVEQAIEMAAM